MIRSLPIALLAVTLSSGAFAGAGQSKPSSAKPTGKPGASKPGVPGNLGKTGPALECGKRTTLIPGTTECTTPMPQDCVAAAGGGKLIAGKSKLLQAQQDITIYRVYGQYDAPLSGGNRVTGPWWTLKPPTEKTMDQYASNYAICRDWNAMKYMAKCKTKRKPMVWHRVAPGRNSRTHSSGRIEAGILCSGS